MKSRGTIPSKRTGVGRLLNEPVVWAVPSADFQRTVLPSQNQTRGEVTQVTQQTITVITEELSRDGQLRGTCQFKGKN